MLVVGSSGKRSNKARQKRRAQQTSKQPMRHPSPDTQQADRSKPWVEKGHASVRSIAWRSQTQRQEQFEPMPPPGARRFWRCVRGAQRLLACVRSYKQSGQHPKPFQSINRLIDCVQSNLKTVARIACLCPPPRSRDDPIIFSPAGRTALCSRLFAGGCFMGLLQTSNNPPSPFPSLHSIKAAGTRRHWGTHWGGRLSAVCA